MYANLYDRQLMHFNLLRKAAKNRLLVVESC